MREQLTMDRIYGNEIASLTEPHLACALLLDTSGSMQGAPIRSLNESIQQFKATIVADPIARKRVEIAIITFDSKVTVVNDFCPIDKMPTPNLDAYGFTEMGQGILKAVEMVKNRTNLYQSAGTPCHKPWIFMITDGENNSGSCGDMEAAIAKVREEESKGSNGHLSFWALGVGDYNPTEMFKLTNRVIELKDCDFEGIFDWLSESMSAISQSQVGEHIQFTELPENARKTKEDRAIGDDWI